MATNRKSGHDRKRWRITFKLPIVHHQHTQRPMTLSTDEFSFTSYGYAAGVAVQRAWQQLRAVPELKGAIIRDCFITVKCLGYFTKADEGLAQAGDSWGQAFPEGSATGPMDPEAEESDIPDGGNV